MAMSNPNQSTGSAASDAAVALAEASAAAGTAVARVGYQLTTEALKESGAATVFPLLVVELTAVAEGLAAYAATDVAALAATVEATAAAELAAAQWNPTSP